MGKTSEREGRECHLSAQGSDFGEEPGADMGAGDMGERAQNTIRPAQERRSLERAWPAIQPVQEGRVETRVTYKRLLQGVRAPPHLSCLKSGCFRHSPKISLQLNPN